MTGPECYRAALDCLDSARRASDKGRGEDATFWQREGQVLATLADAAATALTRITPEGLPEADRKAWYQAASEGPGAKERFRLGEAADLAAIAQEATA